MIKFRKVTIQNINLKERDPELLYIHYKSRTVPVTHAKRYKPEELNDCGIFSRDLTEATKATGPIPHELFRFSCSVDPLKPSIELGLRTTELYPQPQKFKIKK